MIKCAQCGGVVKEPNNIVPPIFCSRQCASVWLAVKSKKSEKYKRKRYTGKKRGGRLIFKKPSTTIFDAFERM